ncbi:MAG: MFS transporter [Austwickia sp.]|nr:MAG: MFS transporter [Austwickia sp.]
MEPTPGGGSLHTRSAGPRSGPLGPATPARLADPADPASASTHLDPREARPDQRRPRPSTYDAPPATPTPAGGDAQAPWPLRRNRPYWLFWTGETISVFGTEVTSLLISLLAVVVLDASPVWVGIINAALWLPWVLIGLPTGAWVDQRAPRSVMVASDLAAAAALLSIPITWSLDMLTTLQLAVVTFAVGTTNVFFRSAYPKLLATLVRREDLPPANSYLTGSESVAQVGGPSIGGALAGLFAPAVAVLVDAASYVVSAACLLFINEREKDRVAPPPTTVSLRERIATGWRFTFADRYLRYFTIQGALSNTGLTGFQALLVLVLVRELGLSGPQVGLAIAVQGVGSLIGAMIAPSVGRRFGSAHGTVFLFCGVGVGALLLPWGAPGWRSGVMLAGMFLIGVGVVCANVLRGAWRQSYVPLSLMARTSTATQTVNYSLMPIAAVLAGWLAQEFGLIPAVGVMAAIVAFVSFTVLVSPLRGLRDMPGSPSEAALSAANVPPPAWQDMR